MGLFSRRKSSIQSFGGQSTIASQSEYENTPQLRPLSGDAPAFEDTGSPPHIPFNDRTSKTNNSIHHKSSRLSRKQSRPTTAQSENRSFALPTLLPKPKKNERPPSAASRVFFNNGQPITPTGKSPRRRNLTVSQPVIPKDISATNLRSMTSVRSLKVKSLDLLKSNPRLKYLSPDPAPPPSRSAPSPALRFQHDGRGLFATKTVANLADELDTRGLRKLLDRDSRRNGRYRSTDDLNNYYSGMPEQIPHSRGTSHREHDSIPSRGLYNPFADPGPSTVRPVFGSDRTDSLASRHTESRLTEPHPQESVNGPQPRSPASVRKHNLPPILLFGQDGQREDLEDKRTESPIILLAPNSAKSTETQSTIPLSPAQISPKNAPIHVVSRPLHPPPLPSSTLRPPILSFETESETSGQEFETADEYGSETPNNLSDNDSLEEWHDSPIVPQEKPIAQTFIPQPSESETSSILDLSELESLSEPIFQSHIQWQESPVIGTIIPSFATIRLPSRDSSTSEGSWLSGKMDIEKAVRKSFHATSPRGTPPIILESNPMSTGLDVAAMNARVWGIASPDYTGEEYGDEDVDGRERMRQGSLARKVEVVDSHDGVEGVVGRVSGESPERGRENGGIVLL